MASVWRCSILIASWPFSFIRAMCLPNSAARSPPATGGRYSPSIISLPPRSMPAGAGASSPAGGGDFAGDHAHPASSSGGSTGWHSLLQTLPSRSCDRNQGGLRLFTDVVQGERLLLMYSSQEGLLQRSLNAMRVEPWYGVDVELQPIGALIIFCAGCRLALGDMLCQFVEQSQARLGKIPFITPLLSASRGGCPMASWPTAT